MSILRYEKPARPRSISSYDLLLRLLKIVAGYLLALFAWLQGADWLAAQLPGRWYVLLGFEAILALNVLIIGAWVVYPGWHHRADAAGGRWGVLALAGITQLTTALFGWLVWGLVTLPLD